MKYFLIEPSHRLNKIVERKQLANSKHQYPGVSLTDELAIWVREKTGAPVSRVPAHKARHLVAGRQDFIFTWVGTSYGPGWLLYLLQIIAFAIRVRRWRSSLVVFMPDTFYPDAAIVAHFLVGITNGTTVVKQHTYREASRYGYRNVADETVHWEWSLDRFRRNAAKIRPVGGERLVLLPRAPKGSRKDEIAGLMAKAFEEEGFNCLRTWGEISYEEYLTLLGTAEALVTTCTLQEQFVFGPARYRARLSATTTTGRVWDSFASGTALFCDRTEVLDALGFAPEVHYFELENFLGTSGRAIPSAERMQAAALRGHQLFQQRLAEIDVLQRKILLASGGEGRPEAC